MNKVKKISLYAVYGTLKRGHGNYRYLLDNDKCEFKGTTKTEPKFSLYHLGGFPGIKNGGETEVEIEVFDVKEESIENRVDGLEGYRGPNENGNMYNKEVIDTEFGKAYIYVYNGNISGDRLIKDGKW